MYYCVQALGLKEDKVNAAPPKWATYEKQPDNVLNPSQSLFHETHIKDLSDVKEISGQMANLLADTLK